MKKLYYFVLIFILTITIANAHEKASFATQQLTSQVGYYKLFETMLPDSTLALNAAGNKSYSILYSYSSENEIVETIPQTNIKTASKFDNSGRRVNYKFYQVNSENNKLELYNETRTTYQKGDRIKKHQMFWPSDSTAIPYSKEYQYDNNNLLISMSGFYKDINNDGILDFAQCTYSSYIKNDTVFVDEYNVVTEGSDSVSHILVTKSKIIYDLQDREIYFESEERPGGWSTATESLFKITRAFNDKGKITEEIEKSYSIETGIWKLNSKKAYQYDAEGNCISQKVYSNESEQFIRHFKYYYPNSQSSIETGKADSNVKLSIVNGILTVDSNQAETVSVYSITGVQIITFNKSEGQASISIPQIGIVIVKGSSGWATKTISK